MAAELAIVVGTYNRLEQLKQLVASVERETTTSYELYLSDAGSTDGTIEWLAEKSAADGRIKAVFEGERRGQAAALNAVFSTLRTRWTCWLSDDNIVSDGGLDIAAAALAADPGLGMVGLKVRDLRGPFVAAPYIGGITCTGVLNINQGVLPTALLQSLGGFSERYRNYGIDADLTTRVLLTGFAVALTRKVAVLHTRNWDAPETPEGKRLDDRNTHYKMLYEQTFGPRMGADRGWMVRRAVWKSLRCALPGRLAMDSPRPIAGFLVRDWHNMIAGRFVSLTHELAHRDSPVHLVQRCPAGLVRGNTAMVSA